MSNTRNHTQISRRSLEDRSPSRTRRHGAVAVFITATLASSLAQALVSVDYQQIDEGFRLFTQETFDGNGRTCSTCHVPEVNYNIFPSTIQKMGQKDRDLVFATNVPGLENIELVRSHALFNISGSTIPPAAFLANEPNLFDDSSHTNPMFRGSMGIQALAITSLNDSPQFPGTPLLPEKCSEGFEAQLPQFGWSGDAAPGTPRTTDDATTPSIDESVACHTHHGNLDALADGSIRAFANGAIAQHNTKTLGRIVGSDFRFASADEANALAAFQLWLGRRDLTADENTAQGTSGATEFNLRESLGKYLRFADARADLGRRHYVGPAECVDPAGPTPDTCLGPDGHPLATPTPDNNAGANCSGCHPNGGALSNVGGNGTDNTNINTEVELSSHDIGESVVGNALPHDEGASNSFGGRPAVPGFDETFNVQSVIEAPRKQAWFHNHKIQGQIEDAIEHYISRDFLCGAEDDDNLETCDNAPPARTGEQVMRFGNTNKSIDFPNGDGIEHLGAFLRVLSAYYSLRDCERLVTETKDRIAVGASPDLPVKHCQFNLADVRKVLLGSKLLPLPYESLANQALPVSNELKNALKKATKKEQTDRLDAVLVKLGEMRTQIATLTTP